MGLAAPKNRSKISNDPRNNNWANNTDRFGHRILKSQGWQPGESLGAINASHAAHYTVASRSHIRVLLKDDTMGLGAKRGSERAENFGLAGLESILGRLNGREEEVKQKEERQEQIERRAYVHRKHGWMNFVSGGFLVADKITKRVDMEKEPKDKIETQIQVEDESKGSNKQNRKRKRDENMKDAKAGECKEKHNSKRKKKSMRLREESTDQIDIKLTKTKMDREGSDQESKLKGFQPSSFEIEAYDAAMSASGSELLTEKARRKAEKIRKEKKELKKASRKAAQTAAPTHPCHDRPISKLEEDGSVEDGCMPSSLSAASMSTPAVAPVGLKFHATNARGIHAVRQRWIRQKKAATMSAQALNEILMIKAPK